VTTTAPLSGDPSLADEPIGGTSGADRHGRALPFLLGGYLLVFAAVTMVNVALPSAQADLGMSDAGRQWLLTTYSLTFGGLMLLGGRLGDVLGLRRAVVIGLIGFAAASLLGGLAPNGALLLAGRALQGASGALVAPSGLALLSVMYPAGPGRARAFGVLGTVMGLGTAGSFVAAGWLTDVATWRWCLLVNTPIALVAALGLTRTAPLGTAGERPRVDVLSAVTVTAGLTALVLGFDQAARDRWTAAPTIALLAAGALLVGAFVVVAARVRAPLFPLRLLSVRARATAYAAVFFLAVAMFAAMYFVTVHLQDVLGYSALRTGVAFLPFGVASMAVSRLLAARASRLRTGPTLAAGLVVIAAALALLASVDPSSAYVSGVLPATLLMGAGGTMVMVTASNAATVDAGADAGVASAAVGATQQIGAALGTALLGSIAAAATESRYGGGRPATIDDGWLEAVSHGLGRAATVGALLTVAGAVVVVAATARRSRRARTDLGPRAS